MIPFSPTISHQLSTVPFIPGTSATWSGSGQKRLPENAWDPEQLHRQKGVNCARNTERNEEWHLAPIHLCHCHSL